MRSSRHGSSPKQTARADRRLIPGVVPGTVQIRLRHDSAAERFNRWMRDEGPHIKGSRGRGEASVLC